MSTSTWRQSEVFIASSGRAVKLAEALATFVMKSNEITADHWRLDTFHASNPYLADLVAAAEKASFAVVLFTKDDKIIQSKDEQARVLDVPRDNCIFELGLFIGALGLNPDRCIVVGSIGDDAMPTDLRGRSFIPFKEDDEDINDWETCVRLMKPVSVDLVKHIREIKP